VFPGGGFDIATRLALTPRIRLVVLLRRLTVYSATELLLLVLIAIQTARLIWTMVTPLGPVGDWKAASGPAMRADGTVFAAFDPFFRLSAGGPVVVTSLNLRLTGVREDRATGRGSAIIQLPDGRQLNFLVGEEIMPGVILSAVGFDNVTISRGGAQEQIFMDQSGPVAVAGVDPNNTIPGAPGTQPQVVTPQGQVSGTVAGLINFTPRLAGGGINGVMVTPGSDGGRAFSAAGFQPGDVIVMVNGQRVTSLEQARAAMGAGGVVSVMVERGGRGVPLQVRLN
jgi:general secretion pathway protein C